MVLGGVGHRWVVMLVFLGGLVVMSDQRIILATAKAVWVFLRGLGRWWEILHDGKAILAIA